MARWVSDYWRQNGSKASASIARLPKPKISCSMLTTGSILDWVRNNSAILLNCDYRLLPEATGNDILDDVADFWAWLQKDFPTAMGIINSNIQPDLEDIAVIGESAGK
jgi:hypothetical protein